MEPKPLSRPGRSWSDRTISAVRSAWYRLYEPLRLRWERLLSVYAADPVYTLLVPRASPLVTVIIPTFNRGHLLLNRALSSVRNQTYPNLEIIVADHGSTDGTWAAVCRIDDPRVRLLRVPRRRHYPPTAENHWFAGPVDPLNAALKVARGDWIARIDDDDEWTPDHIERLLRFALAGDWEFVSSAYERVREGTFSVVWHDDTVPLIGGVQTWLYRSYLKFMTYNPDCWRKSWNRVNDTDLADRMRKAGVRIGWLGEVTAFVKPRPGETTVGLEAYRRSRSKIEAALV